MILSSKRAICDHAARWRPRTWKHVLAAVAVAARREHALPSSLALSDDLGDAGEVLADGVGVGLGRPELVEVDLLVEAEVLLGALALARVARVPEASAVGVPGDAASGGAVVDVRHHVRELLAASRRRRRGRPRLGAALREGDRDELAVE